MIYKKTTEQFIQEANKLFPQYDYSLVDYKNNKTKVTIICPVHGKFEVVPDSLLSKHSCKKCAIEKKTKTTEQFIQEAKLLHPEYDYSAVKYVNNKTKVEVKCLEHGIFFIKPNDFLSGYSCFKCGVEKRTINNSKTTEQFIQEAKSLHPEYDYSKVNYKNCKTYIKIICPIHGEFKILPNVFLCGNGCQKCVIENRTKTTEQFIQEAKLLHPEYDYSKVDYKNNKTKVIIICPIHGEFKITPNNLLGKKQNCPKCASSIGEKTIRNILESNNIKFQEQYRIPECRNKLPLPFDFAIFDDNNMIKVLIEFQGEQHFKPVDFFGGNGGFVYRKRNDLIKKEFCEKNDILLVEITYKDNIEEVLNKEIL